jgi:hypothetical protein
MTEFIIYLGESMRNMELAYSESIIRDSFSDHWVTSSYKELSIVNKIAYT